MTLQHNRLMEPSHWKKPRRVFVCSMGDLFHPKVPFEFIRRVFGLMHHYNKHVYMFLTKRPDRMAEFIQYYSEWVGFNAWPREYKHVILGVTVENNDYRWRIEKLLQIPAAGYFVSHEPALGMVDYPPEFLALGIRAWLDAGGESGPGARPVHPDWIRHDRDQCQAAGVAFFFKQWGEWLPNAYGDKSIPEGTNFNVKHYCFEDGLAVAKVGKKAAGRLLDGRTWDEFPEVVSQ